MSTTAAAPSRKTRQSHWLEAIADPVRLQILRSLSQVDSATAAELAAGSPASHQTLRRHLEALQASGLIVVSPGVSEGTTGGRPAMRYGLRPGVRESVRSADRAS